MEKGILHIQLVNRPRARESKRENGAHSSRLHHWTEGLIIVHTRPLGATSENLASLLALQRTIRPTLMRPDPLASDHIATRRARHEVPRLVGKKSPVLLFHRATPVRIRQDLTDGRGNRRDPRLSLGGGERRQLKDSSRLLSHHGMNMSMSPMNDRRVVHGGLHTRATRWRWRRWWRWR